MTKQEIWHLGHHRLTRVKRSKSLCIVLRLDSQWLMGTEYCLRTVKGWVKIIDTDTHKADGKVTIYLVQDEMQESLAFGLANSTKCCLSSVCGHSNLRLQTASLNGVPPHRSVSYLHPEKTSDMTKITQTASYLCWVNSSSYTHTSRVLLNS